MNNTTTNLKMKKRFAGSYDARCGGISFRTDKWDSVWVVRAWIGGAQSLRCVAEKGMLHESRGRTGKGPGGDRRLGGICEPRGSGIGAALTSLLTER